ncbi:MAG: hypothetical protein QOK90_07670 [Nitrososphaeraceae archaeon]|jgi:hypothetical protein|nr:hypothetical protein [Nitrososphaeraceae archaeon]
MQKEKINRPFFKYWKSITYDLIQKAIESQNKVIGRLLFLFRVNNSNAVILRKIIPYVFSGGSIIFIGYVLMNIFTNYPPRVIGISP